MVRPRLHSSPSKSDQPVFYPTSKGFLNLNYCQMKRFILLTVLLCFFKVIYSQGVGVGTPSPDASSQMDITSATKGLLIPRMSIASINAIPNPARGLLVYDSVNNKLMVNMGSSSLPNWQTVVAKSGWNLNGNSGTNPAF